jgi:hypothetical protein
MKRPVIPKKLNKQSLSWITKGLTSKAYPYEIVDNVRGYSVWMYGERHYENLARELPSLKVAKAFCEQHAKQQKETE